MIEIKDWRVFQHYKDRRPPWIKLHRTLLDDCDFLRLPLASRALAPLLWLLASESDHGTIAMKPEDIAYRLRLPIDEIKEGISGLVSIGYITCKDDASITIADRKQHVILETEVEAKKEVETHRFVPPTPIEVTEYSKQIGYPMDGQAWCDSYEQKGWMVGRAKMKSWKAAVRNWKTNKWSPVPKAKDVPHNQGFGGIDCNER